ncbi:CpsD/CapB family tyrosine-protein kinase [Hydrogenophaga sp.]|uniref:CpsD/CapB family tyrosine-protein kinase n=1 Tax=Hydrogenophaga sp. TaxID=1904254 RepID=UPI0027255DDE|nr:CpsD/CapB family tyrosine-protein kinase [Hydrogenophaga sp.]MDO8903158.1 CpsD/CapB family tyrosine-protein kinase [Hydrogenophaga sp.]
MERIKLAIEKAKSQSTQGVVSEPPLVESQPLHTLDDAGPVASPTLPPIATQVDVRYERTQVMKLDQAHLDRHRVIAHQKTHPANWAFDVLRTQVLQQMDENGWRTLAITSPTMESGKTLVSINLAMSIAHQTDRTALLVDFDLRRPRVSSLLGLQRSVSLNEVLTDQVDLAEAMVNPGMPRLVVLPTSRPVLNASEVLSSAKVAGLITELRERYSDRIVLFDLPPVLAADDVMAILPRIDCVLMVVASGMSTEKEIEESMARLSRANLLGVVLNKDKTPTSNAYY